MSARPLIFKQRERKGSERLGSAEATVPLLLQLTTSPQLHLAQLCFSRSFTTSAFISSICHLYSPSVKDHCGHFYATSDSVKRG